MSTSTTKTETYFKVDDDMRKRLEAIHDPNSSKDADALAYQHARDMIFSAGAGQTPHRELLAAVHQTMIALQQSTQLIDVLTAEEREQLLPWDLRSTLYDNTLMCHAKAFLKQQDLRREDGHITFPQLIAEAVAEAMHGRVGRYLFTEAQLIWMDQRVVMSTYSREHPGREQFYTWAKWLENLAKVWQAIGEGKQLTEEQAKYTITSHRHFSQHPLAFDEERKMISLSKTRAQVEPDILKESEEDAELMDYVKYLGETLVLLARVINAYHAPEYKRDVSRVQVLNAITTLHLNEFRIRNQTWQDQTQQEVVDETKAATSLLLKVFGEQRFKDTHASTEKIFDAILDMRLPASLKYDYNFTQYTQLTYLGTIPINFKDWEHALKDVFHHTGINFSEAPGGSTFFVFSDLQLTTLLAIGIAKQQRMALLRKALKERDDKAMTEAVTETLKTTHLQADDEASEYLTADALERSVSVVSSV